ncbi:hypothetical protein GCM10027022_04040 [Alpinimonas psychrophila]
MGASNTHYGGCHYSGSSGGVDLDARGRAGNRESGPNSLGNIDVANANPHFDGFTHFNAIANSCTDSGATPRSCRPQCRGY